MYFLLYTYSGRKRRPSNSSDDIMDDCMAAMVLMSLSCSPKSPRLPEGILKSIFNIIFDIIFNISFICLKQSYISALGPDVFTNAITAIRSRNMSAHNISG